MQHLLLLCLVFVSLFGYLLADSCSLRNPEKIDCGYVGVTQPQCEQKGCCWSPCQGCDPSVPWCFHPASSSVCNFTLASDTTSPPFSSSEMETMSSYFYANINIAGKGGVVASPDKMVPGGGSYYYHWERDGALTMRAVLLTNATGADQLLKNYAQWVLRRQSDQDPNGIDVRVEPKYELPDGGPYSGGWCRPQTDGPGLRSITLIEYANHLLASGQADYVKSYLWTNGPYNGGAIKYDLDWVTQYWQTNSCDLWEEVQSDNFFWNRMAFKNALFLGSELAKKLGDQSSADKYMSAMLNVNATLYDHFNGDFVFESTYREKDSAVILAFNDGYTGDGLFSPTTVEVAQTVSAYNKLFCSTFAINQADNKRNIPGIMYGRYEGDTYVGGNPWILSSGALAQLFYNAGNEVKANGLPKNAAALKVWSQVLGLKGTLTPSRLQQAFLAAGDGVLLRIKYHTKGDNLHLYEQIDRNTGSQVSAFDLTWSYATVIKAMFYRNKLTA